MTTTLLPDAEAIAIAWLLDSAEVMALVGTRVYAEPIENVTDPFLTIERFGGVPEVRHWLDHAELQVTAWGTTRPEARLICETAIAALHDIDMNDPLGIVNAVEDLSGARSLPDPVTSRPRFIAEVRMTLHPTPGGS